MVEGFGYISMIFPDGLLTREELETEYELLKIRHRTLEKKFLELQCELARRL